MSFKTPVVTPPPSKTVGEHRFVPPSAAQQDSVLFDLGEISISDQTPGANPLNPISLEIGSEKQVATPGGDTRIKIGKSVSPSSGDQLVQMQQDLRRLQTTVQMIFQHLVLKDIERVAGKADSASHRSSTGLLTKRTLADFAHSQLPHSAAHEGLPGRERSLPGTSFRRIAMWKRIVRWMFVTSTERHWTIASFVTVLGFFCLAYSARKDPTRFGFVRDYWLIFLAPAIACLVMQFKKGPLLRRSLQLKE